jgi:hypothetical protein
MGRWAQAKRRSSRGSTEGGLPLVGVPTLGDVGGLMQTTATPASNPNGTLQLQFSEAEGGPYEEDSTIGWSPVWNWKGIGDAAGFYWRVRATGGGQTCVGETYSAVLDLT